MAQLGLDPDQMDALASKMTTEAGTIKQIATAITGQLNSTWWQGPDAERFKGEWQGTHAAALNRAAEALDAVSQLVKQEASQQRQVSGA